MHQILFENGHGVDFHFDAQQLAAYGCTNRIRLLKVAFIHFVKGLKIPQVA